MFHVNSTQLPLKLKVRTEQGSSLSVLSFPNCFWRTFCPVLFKRNVNYILFVSAALLFWWHSVLIQVHISASECLLEIFKLFRQISSVYSSNIGIKGELVHQCEMEKNMEAKSLLKKCIDILENLEVKNVQATWFAISLWNYLLHLHVNLKLLDVEYHGQENYFLR